MIEVAREKIRRQMEINKPKSKPVKKLKIEKEPIKVHGTNSGNKKTSGILYGLVQYILNAYILL